MEIKDLPPDRQEIAKKIKDESERVYRSLEKAFASEGLAYDEVRFQGTIAGCASFIVDLAACIAEKDDNFRNDLLFEICSLVGKKCGYIKTQKLEAEKEPPKTRG